MLFVVKVSALEIKLPGLIFRKLVFKEGKFFLFCLGVSL